MRAAAQQGTACEGRKASKLIATSQLTARGLVHVGVGPLRAICGYAHEVRTLGAEAQIEDRLQHRLPRQRHGRALRQVGALVQLDKSVALFGAMKKKPRDAERCIFEIW